MRLLKRGINCLRFARLDVFRVVHQRTTRPRERCSAATLQGEDSEIGALRNHHER